MTSFILLTDGSVYQCSYNLKSCQVSISKTDYTEVQINQMKEKQLQEEQQKLEQEQKAEKQKLQKKKVEKKKRLRRKEQRSNIIFIIRGGKGSIPYKIKHRCVHIMRILQGLNERGKRHILCAKIKQIKLRKHYVWTNCPDKKKQKKIKIAFRQIVQT